MSNQTSQIPSTFPMRELSHITGYPLIMHLVQKLLELELSEGCNPVEKLKYEQAYARVRFEPHFLQAVSSALTEIGIDKTVSTVTEHGFGNFEDLQKPLRKFVSDFYDWFDNNPFGVEE